MPTLGCQRGEGGARLGRFGGVVGSGCIAQDAAALQWAQTGEEAGIAFHMDAWEGRGGAEDVPSHGMEQAPDKGSHREILEQEKSCSAPSRSSHDPTAPGPGVVGGSSRP